MELSEIRNMLKINRHRLDDELEVHSEIMDRIGQRVVKLNGRQIELKRQMEITEAKVISRLKDDDPKMTNPIAEKEAKGSRDYETAWKAYQVARAEHEEWEVVQKAWYQRGFDIKALGDLFGNQYFALDSVRGPYPSNMEGLRSKMRQASERSESLDEEVRRPRRRTLVDS